MTAQTQQKLSVGEKVGYSLGDTAANFVFQTMLVFQLSFYTDAFGISAAAAATLFLVVRVVDAFFDFSMGAIADRTNTRWGKFRPWVLWTALPFGVLGYLAFMTPDFGTTGKLVYAYVTYTMLMVLYSMNNIPYSALSGVMTSDIAERTSLSSYRFVFAMLGAFAIQAIAPHMLTVFGTNDDGTVNYARGYQVTMGIFAVLSVIFFVITFATTKERVHPDPSQKSTVGQDLRDLGRNGPWIALFALTVFVFITLAMRGSVMKYYFDYYLTSHSLFGRDLDEDPVLGIFNAFGLFNALGLITTIVAIFFSKPLAMRFGKRNTFIAGLLLTTIVTAVFYVIPPHAVGAAFAVEMVRQACYGITIPLLWAMMADVADYSEWKNGRRATGIAFSGIVFGLKVGLGFGGAISGWLLAQYGYVPNAAQSARALDGIRLTASIYPAIPFAVGVGCLFFYAINKQLNIRIAEELDERRRTGASLYKPSGFDVVTPAPKSPEAVVVAESP